MPKYTKRESNKHLCNGTCGKPNCRFMTTGFSMKNNLEKHLSLKKNNCTVCFKTFKENSTYYRHFRKAHNDLLNVNGGCNKHDVPDKKSKKLKPPEDLRSYKIPFQYLKDKIRDSIKHDYERKNKHLPKSIKKYTKLGLIDKVKKYTNILSNYQNVVPKTNTTIHELAIQWLRYLVDTNRMDNFQHESGLTIDYKFQKHGGLFNISLDRINNDYPHFYGSLDAFKNVRDMPLCLNTACNPMIHYPKFKDQVLIRLNSPYTLKHHQLTSSTSISYICIKNIWSSKRMVNNQVEHDLLVNMFHTRDNFQSYCLKVLEDQKYKCAISGIYLLNGLQDTMHANEKVFSMSINAIDPTLGHVKGNIEWVCRFINVINVEKTKTYHYKDDPPNAWTKELFQQYFLK